MSLDRETLGVGLKCLCPKCKKSSIYPSKWLSDLYEACPSCGLDLRKNDSADGPAVFLIFILGFLVTPLALLADMWFSWPLWAHAIVWGVVLIALTLGSLRPLKAYIIALQYKHRRRDWES